MSYTPISCEQHDLIEIFCMRHNKVAVTLHSGEQFCAQAEDVGIISGQGEWLHFSNHESVRLDQIKAISLA
ncbi:MULTISPECIES: Rho-binding antiterminator [unclassified Pseudoalteromonas]|uniref:Rho-binding antiterminator n=1 Tax=unclassified Pseudoalteromonas TaxID=194690 RepID=UPI000CF6DCC1|nr:MULTISPECIES: Rho-binding antiterminator [unclassified Pseudoalteromonas]